MQKNVKDLNVTEMDSDVLIRRVNLAEMNQDFSSTCREELESLASGFPAFDVEPNWEDMRGNLLRKS